MKTYSGYGTDIARIINNTDSDNLSWSREVVMDSIRYLVTKYYFNERTYTTNTVAQQQFYNLPPQVKKLINTTVTIGSVVWLVKECPSRDYWDSLNNVTFYQDYPAFFFVYNGQVGIFPAPASSGNRITMNYKTRIPDLSMDDIVSSGTTVALTNGSTTVTGSSSIFTNWMAGNTYLKVPHSNASASNGDNQWYAISTVSSGTTAILAAPYQGATLTTGTVTIGEVPILPEDYQDLPLYRLGYIYYTTRFPDAQKSQLYQNLYDTGLKALDDEFGSKTTNVVLTDTDAPIVNPNLFQRNLS
jgi:hypothetical protein